jgi:hypothetical protein
MLTLQSEVVRLWIWAEIVKARPWLIPTSATNQAGSLIGAMPPL